MPVPIDLSADELRHAGRVADALAAHALASWLPTRRWFASKSRRIRTVAADDAFDLSRGNAMSAALALVRVEYDDGGPIERYVIPFAVAGADDPPTSAGLASDHVIATIASARAIVHDRIGDAWGPAILALLTGSAAATGRASRLEGEATREGVARCHAMRNMQVRPLGAEQSNTSFVIGDHLVVKVVRRIEPGPNPDYEVGRHLSERTPFAHGPAVIGAVHHLSIDGPSSTIVMVQRLVANEGDAWTTTVRALGALPGDHADTASLPPPPPSLVDAALRPPQVVSSGLDTLARSAERLGIRTAEMHAALSADAGDPAFQAVPLDGLARAALARRMMTDADATLALIARTRERLTGQAVSDADALEARAPQIRRLLDMLARTSVELSCIRVHGDYHLGQVLVTGDDFVILDFEGEPARSLDERRAPQVALKDVAGMLRSYGYAAWTACLAAADDDAPIDRIAPRARALDAWLSVAFLRGYLDAARGLPFLPADRVHLDQLLQAFLIDKALYEVRYEIDHRPDWLRIPLQALLGSV